MNETTRTADEMISWMRSQTDHRITVSEPESDTGYTMIMKTQYAEAQINIYYLEFTIIEFRIDNHNGENVFYLHFELNDIDRAKELFTEMKTCLLRQRADSRLHVMLCCTAGLTTSYFTMKLNEAAAAMDLKMDFEAVSYERLYQNVENKDVVLLAPQIGYRYKDACAVLSDKLVLLIPAGLFGSYDAFGVINYVRNNYEQKQQEAETVHPQGVQALTESSGSVLIVSVVDMEARTQLAYRIYNKGEVSAANQIVKETYRAEDILDVIDSVIRLNDEIKTICLVSPGSFHDGHLTYEKEGIIDFNLKEALEHHGDRKLVMLNATDMIALGYTMKERNGAPTAFYFLPSSDIAGTIAISDSGTTFGTAGSMGGSQLDPLTEMYTFPKNPYSLVRTPEGSAKLAARYLTGLIAYTGIPHIAYYAKMIPDTEALVKEISEFIKPEYIPEIKKVSSVRDYLYEGALYRLEHGKD